MDGYVWIWGRAQAALDFFYRLQGEGGRRVFYAETWSDCLARMEEDGGQGRMYAFPDERQCTQLPRFFAALSSRPCYDLQIACADVSRWHLSGHHLRRCGDLTFARFTFQRMPLGQRILKRSFDTFVCGAGLLALLPVFLLCAFLVKTGSKGPVLYSQERIGKGGKPFRIYKFRSMRADAEDSVPKLSHAGDPRITRWGAVMRKFRLDELPQFWNVVRGDMSLVGYRPERDYFIRQIEQRAPYFPLLYAVRPGVTSLFATTYSYAENMDQMMVRLSCDIEYLENYSVKQDLQVMMKTVPVVLKGIGK